jgi:hypothetical protein
VKLTRPFSLLSLTAAPALAQITQAEYAARHTALSTELPGDGIVVVTEAPEPKHDYDVFTQDYAFNYLTGFPEPDAALVIVHKGGNDVRRQLSANSYRRTALLPISARIGNEAVDPRAVPLTGVV